MWADRLYQIVVLKLLLRDRTLQQFLPMPPNHMVEDLPHLLTAIDADGQHALQAADRDPGLHQQDGDLVGGAEGTDGQEGQFLFFGAVEVEEGIGVIVVVVAVVMGVGVDVDGGAGGAGDDVVGHGDAGVDEGEGGGVEAGGEEGAVLGEDVQVEGDGGAGVEGGEDDGGEGGG